jgi:pyrroloquinoline-quinone synthase
VQFVRDSPLLDAVASSLTELFAPTLMARRLEAWQHHYPWVKPDALQYFQGRMSRASLDSKQGLEFVVEHATTRELQERCVRALIKKAEILWHLLDCVQMASVDPHDESEREWHDRARPQAAAQP